MDAFIDAIRLRDEPCVGCGYREKCKHLGQACTLFQQYIEPANFKGRPTREPDPRIYDLIFKGEDL